MTQQVQTPQRSGATAPFADFDRLFGRMMRGWPFNWPDMPTAEPRALRAFEHMPNVEVKENGKAYTVSMELPGLDEKDISLTVQNGVLTIQGEKKLDYDEQKENYHVMERRYGSFQRSLRLPDIIDDTKIDARFDNGVLRVMLPKRPELAGEQRKIDIKKSQS